MSKSTIPTAKPSAEDAVKKAVEDTPGATAEAIAGAAGIGQSTAGKMLARLAQSGEITRFEGGREQGKRLPDRWTLAGVEIPPPDATHTATGSAAKVDYGTKQPSAAEPAKATGTKPASATDGKPSAIKANANKLKPGQLEPLVLDYLKENADSGPHSPTTVAKALQRSSGAVGNCLVRLTRAKKVHEVSEHPRRYSLAA